MFRSLRSTASWPCRQTPPVAAVAQEHNRPISGWPDCLPPQDAQRADVRGGKARWKLHLPPAASLAKGKATVKQNVLPRPSSLSTQIRPSINSTNLCRWKAPAPCRQSAAPSRRRPGRRAGRAVAVRRAECRCRYHARQIPACAFPPPPEFRAADADLHFARSVNLMALPARLNRTCCKRVRSPMNPSGNSSEQRLFNANSFSLARIATRGSVGRACGEG